MSQARMTLDNPVFAGTLRYTRRSVSYKSRPLQPRTIQDVVAVRRAAPLQGPNSRVKLSRAAPDARQRHIKVSIQQTLPTSQRVRANKKTTKRTVSRRTFPLKTATLYITAVLLLGFGVYVGINGMMANKKVAAQVKALQATSPSAGDSAAPASGASPPPSSQKVPATSVRQYTVAPSNPRYIDIPKLGIHARVLSITVNSKNELQAPYGIYDAGWYTSSALPGQNGAMLVDGHSGIGKTHGIFHDLSKLTVGDQITITRGDGQTFTYKVAKTAIVDAAKVDMGSLLVSQDTAKPGLNLITCAGDWIPGTFSLKQRALVYAVMQ